MQNHKSAIGMFLLQLCLCAIAVAAPALFKFRDVSSATGATATDTFGLNDAGVIAGDYVSSSGIQHGMLLAGKQLATIDRPDCVTTPSATSIAFYGVNSTGGAAGWCTNTSGVEIAFVYKYGPKTFTDINIPGATLTNANGINDKGAVVGTYVDSSGVQHGFLLAAGKVTNLDPPGVVSLATAWGINNSGVITVWGLDSSGDYLSFTTADNGQTYTPFQAPGEGPLGTAIHQINNNGDIIATYFDSSSNRHGVLFHGGNYYSFDDPNGVNNTRADGLNDTLLIVGRYGTTTNGVGFEAQYLGQ
jgi:probable HAF family extracellular repeat protein